MKKVIFIAKIAACLAGSILIGCLLIILVYMLPVDRMKRNVAASVEVVTSEGSYYQWAPGYKNAQSDNYTDDSLILNALYPGTGNIVADAMNVPRRLFGEDQNENSVLPTVTDSDADTYDVSYGRYWHGSLLFLKTALFFFDLSDIRIFNMILQFALLFLIVIGLCKRQKSIYALGFLAAVIMINPVTSIFCYCFSIEYVLMLVMTVIVLFFNEYLMKGTRYYFFFLISGIIFVYFNELSFPMIGLGIPLTVYVVLNREKVGQLIKKEVMYSVFWGIGYSVMWLGKWICAWILTGQNYIRDAIEQATRYTSDHATWEEQNPSVIDRIYKNIQNYLKWPYLFLAIGIIILIGVLIVFANKNMKICKEGLLGMLPYIFIVLLPFAIFVGLGNGYSFVHYWFTHKLLSISAFAGISMLLQLVQADQVKLAIDDNLSK